MATKSEKKKALTIAQMREVAKQKGIEGTEKMSKAELKTLLEEPKTETVVETTDLEGEK